MISPVTISKIYSTLGNSNSLVPLAIKDVANSAGMSAGSYITGDKHEGKDRFMDEFGTMAIWLLGIPFFNKMLDKTLFKAFGHDPKVDVRNFKNQDILKKSIEFAPNDAIKSSIEKVAKNQKLHKGLTLTKFITSTIMTIVSYGAFTKYRHKVTENAIRKELIAQKEQEQQNKNNNPNFTGGLADFMFNPVKNLMLVDGAITTERFTQSRNKQDLMGYIIKEGAFWGFVYFASDIIKNRLEKKSESKHQRPIGLDSRIIESEELKHSLSDGTLKKALTDFDKFAGKTDVEIYEYINKNPDNFIVKTAKKSDIIPTIKDSDKIDTRKFIDIEEVKGIRDNLEKVLKQFEKEKNTSQKSAEEVLEEFLKSLRKAKRNSVLKNLGICVGALGIAVPAILIAIRFSGGEKQEFETKKEIERQLAKEGY